MTEHIREVIHYPGSLDEPRDAMTEEGDIIPYDQGPDLSVVEGSTDGHEDEPEFDRDIRAEIAHPALELVAPVASISEEDAFIDRETDKGRTFEEAQEMWNQRRNR